MQTTRTRGGVLAITISSLSLITIGTLATLGFTAHTESNAASSTSSLATKRKVPQHEIATVLAEAGLNPQVLAAAGVTGLQCDGIFDAGLAYCIGEDRIPQFQLAHKTFNQAKARAVDTSATVDGQRLTVAQAKDSLENLQQTAFQFVTAGLNQNQIATIQHIRANKHWGLPTKYLVADRTHEEWLALRGALAAKHGAAVRGTVLPQRLAQIIATADSNQDVSRAQSAMQNNLTAVTSSWKTHAPSSSHHDGPP